MGPRKTAIEVLKGAAVFGLLGPALGGFTLAVEILVISVGSSLMNGTSLPKDFGVYAAASLVSLPALSYVIGTVPSLFVGSIAGVLRRYSASLLYVPGIALLGGIVPLVFVSLWAGWDLKPAVSAGFSYVLFVIPGTVAAAFLGASFRWLDRAAQVTRKCPLFGRKRT